MNVMEAVQNGNKFKRKPWAAWYTVTDLRNGRLLLPPSDILADDWEVEQIGAPITVKEPEVVPLTMLDQGILYDSFVSFYNNLRRGWYAESIRNTQAKIDRLTDEDKEIHLQFLLKMHQVLAEKS